MRRPIVLVGGVIFGVLLGLEIIALVGQFQEAAQSGRAVNLSEAPSNPEIGAPAPEFELMTLSGESVHLEDYHGQVVLLNFWASWCGPCRLEMPAFQARFEKYSGDLVILAVNSSDNQETAQAFMDELNLTFEGLLDVEGTIQKTYLVRGLPSSFFIDEDGLLQAVHIGIMTEGQLDDYLMQLGLN